MFTSIRNAAACLIGLALFTATPLSAQVTADDFLPPVQGGTTTVKSLADVKIDGKTVTAATAQDAMNAAVDKGQKELSDGGIGAEMVKFPSGMGIVASGMATYRIMENPTATRLAQRQAYVIAFTQAKKHMAEFLGGLSHEGKENIRTSLANIETSKDSLTNLATDSEESIAQAVDMMLRGFIIYEVRDDMPKQTVYVSIVTTPKTRGKLARPAPNNIEVDDLREGLTQVISEVRSGLVSPVGGRIITMRKTGETAFVGFGSAVMHANANAAVQAKLNLEVQKIAWMRSQDALCGLIIGDQTSWQGSVRTSMHDAVKEFEPLTQNDPLAANETGVKKLDAQRQSFVAKMESSDAYRSARSGVLPPGVNMKTWFNDDNTWAFAMAVYVPSATNAAAVTADDVKNSQIVQPVRSGPQGGPASQPQGSGFKDENNPNVPHPATEVKPGPTGKTKKDDL